MRSSDYVSYDGKIVESAEGPSPLGSESSGTRSWDFTEPLPSFTTANSLSAPSPQPDLLEFLNFLPESTFGNILSPNYGATSYSVEGNSDIIPSIDKTVMGTENNPPGDKSTIQAGIPQPNPEAPGASTPNSQEHLWCLKELCEINVALFQHPLHTGPIPSQRKTYEQTMPTTTSASGSADTPTTGKPHFSVAELQIGQLLSLTARIKKLVAENGGSERQFFQDRSTALLALSCYTRLELVYSRMLDALHELQNSGQHLTDPEPLMPDLSIDGFSLGKCRDVQLKFAIQICQEALKMLRQSIGISGDIQVHPLERPI